MFRSLLRSFAPVLLVGAVAAGTAVVSAPAANAATIAPSVTYTNTPNHPRQVTIKGSGFYPGGLVDIVVEDPSGQVINHGTVVASSGGLFGLLGAPGTFSYSVQLEAWPNCTGTAYVQDALDDGQFHPANPYPLPLTAWSCTS
jgi:hypothetical protein